MIFTFPREDEITSEVVETFIEEHKKLEIGRAHV